MAHMEKLWRAVGPHVSDGKGHFMDNTSVASTNKWFAFDEAKRLSEKHGVPFKVQRIVRVEMPNGTKQDRWVDAKE
jgi:hypothetical protein